MLAPDELQVIVQQEWNGWRTAFVRLRDLADVHWFQPTGAPKPLIHASVPCTSIVEGEIPHDCDPTSAPHRLLVCIVRCHTIGAVYDEIVRQADEQRLPSPGPVNRKVVLGGSR